MQRHHFIPYSYPRDCEQCRLFGTPQSPLCSACAILTDTCKDCDGRKRIIDHILHESCEGCKQVKDCAFYEKANKVLCIPCAAQVVRTQGNIIEKEKHDLALISSDRDFHNAHVMSLVELENGIKQDASIPSEEKLFTYHRMLAERIGHYKETIFNKRKDIQAIEKEISEINLKQKIEEKTIRDYGNEVRKEIQEQLKQQDALYQPVVPKVAKPRGTPAAKKSPFDRMAEAYAAANKGMTVEEAKKLLQKGMAS